MGKRTEKGLKTEINFKSIVKNLQELLYKYMCWYSLIDGIETDKRLTKLFPNLTTKLSPIIKACNLKKVTTRDLEEIPTGLKIPFLYYVGKDTIRLDILRHIRNSIGHDLIKYDKKRKVFIIIDKNSSKKCTAYGEFRKEELMAIINATLETKKL